MGVIDGRLAALGLTLPEPMKPPGSKRLAMVHALGDPGRITQRLRAVEYLPTAADFHDNAAVVNGFSDVIVELWAERTARPLDPGAGSSASQRPEHRRRNRGRRLTAAPAAGASRQGCRVRRSDKEARDGR